MLRSAFLSAYPLCALCLANGRAAVALELDHILPLSKGGSNDECNLQGLCPPCHAAKTAIDLNYGERVTIGVDGWPIEPVKNSITGLKNSTTPDKKRGNYRFGRRFMT